MRRLLILLMTFSISALPTDAASAPSIIFSQIQIEGTSVSDEFIELRNLSSSPASLTDWRIQKRTSSGTVSSIKSFLGECVSLHPGGRLLWANGSGGYASKADYTTTQSLAKTNTFELVDGKGVLVDSLSWGNDALPKKSMLRDPDTLSWSISDTPNPAGGGAFCPADEPKEGEPGEDPPVAPSVSRIRINELFPDPDETGDSGEWIELFNFGDEPADLSGFTIKDASSSGKYMFPEKTPIAPGGYLVLMRSESGISLNNTGVETATLLNKNGSIVDTMNYEGSKEEASLSFDGTAFRWSPFLTPGAENRFSDAPKTKKTSIPKEGFRGVPLEFSADGSEGQKYAWKFGDGKTARGETATHTYKERGTYRGTLTISDKDGLAETVNEFTVRIGSFPKAKVSIAEITPNPEGPDTGSEWIALKNGWKKDLDLSGWSIATGSGKAKLSNHPIRESFVIPEGKTRKITSDIAAFTLQNAGGYVEIRRPDGKVAVAKAYPKPEESGEGAVWKKSASGAWGWEALPVTPESKEEDASKETADDKTGADLHDEIVPEKEVTIDDLPPEQLAILEARIEERLRREILAELESQGRIMAAGIEDVPIVLGESHEQSEEKSATFLEKANALLGDLFSSTRL